MNTERLAEIRQRHEATTGPRWVHDVEGYVGVAYVSGGKATICCTDIWPRVKARGANAEFIAHAHEDVPDLLDEVQRLREEAAQYRQESRTNELLRKVASAYASQYVRQLGSKCREVNALVHTAAELGKEVERLGLLDQIADEGAVRPGWWGRVAARLQERVTELEGENAGLKTKYKRLRDAVNGSLPNDLEYTAALEREVEWLRAKLAAEKKSNPLNAEAHGRNVDDYYKGEATSEGMVEFLQLHAELAENDGCPEEAEKLRGVVGEVKRLRVELLDTQKVVKLTLGRQYNLPWTEISDGDVRSFVEPIRKQREAAEKAAKGKSCSE